jgi:hypothetical protein
MLGFTGVFLSIVGCYTRTVVAVITTVGTTVPLIISRAAVPAAIFGHVKLLSIKRLSIDRIVDRAKQALDLIMPTKIKELN